MGYWRYHCPQCGKYYGGGIPTDDLPTERKCTDCGGSNLSFTEQIRVLFYQFHWLSKKEFMECYKQSQEKIS